MKIALAQLNPTVGDIPGNTRQVLDAAAHAAQGGADLLVTSEMVICGYPPKDLLLRSGFVAACEGAVQELAANLPHGLGVLVGHPSRIGQPGRGMSNAVSLVADGTIVATRQKTLLPNYDVFDEQRYFRPATEVRPIEFGGRRLGVHICEDAWWGQPDTPYHDWPTPVIDPVAELARAGAEILINLSASPFEAAKPARRPNILGAHARRYGLPLVFVNQVGGNDDLVFDGFSIVLNAGGEVVTRLAGFATDSAIVDTSALPGSHSIQFEPRESILLDALILGLRDYMAKCGFTDCVLGLSGGIDSALAAYVAAAAVSPQRVHGLLMPSRYSSQHSIEDARQLAESLGIDWQVIPIDEVHKAYEQLPTIADDLGSQPTGLADQNLQARIRGAIVMVRSNRYGWLALATGNKSELSVGYCTLYGDMAGGFAVLSDLLKRDVYGIARHINEVRDGRESIPNSTIDKAPSAELAPNQFDQDTLPPYPILDGILEGLIEQELSVAELIQKFPEETVRWVVRRVDRNEFKRRQMPPGIKLSARAFGSGRRMPIAARILD